MSRLPGREQSEEEKKFVEESTKTKPHIEKNQKIRCPNCKKNQYFDNYFTQKQMGVLVCPNCGILFIDQHKIKIIRKNISDSKAKKALIK